VDLIAVGYGTQIPRERQPGAVRQIRIELWRVGASAGQRIEDQIVCVGWLVMALTRRRIRCGIGRVQAGRVLEQVVLTGAVGVGVRIDANVAKYCTSQSSLMPLPSASAGTSTDAGGEGRAVGVAVVGREGDAIVVAGDCRGGGSVDATKAMFAKVTVVAGLLATDTRG